MAGKRKSGSRSAGAKAAGARSAKGGEGRAGRKGAPSTPRRGAGVKPSPAAEVHALGEGRAAGDAIAAGRLTHDQVMRAAVEVNPELRRRSQLLWEDRSRSRRGPRAAFTPEDVVRAAMDIADADGLAAVTMQAVSARLGYTTMAIYRYFPSKEALYDAIVDAGLGLPPAPTRGGASWRDAIVRWAHAKRKMLCARPWLAELPFVAAPHGPNWLSWLEALASPLSATGLAAAEVGQMISVIDGYTRGASDTSISLARARARGITEEQWAAEVGADLGRAIGDSRFPAFAAIITAPSDGRARTMEESFDFGLQRVLDGIELYIKSVK